MKAYFLRRILLIIPTLFGIMLLNFALVQLAPGGPVENLVMQLSGKGEGGIAGMSGGSELGHGTVYRGARGLDPTLVEGIKKLYGFDKPPVERFKDMVIHYLKFDFGTSFYQDKTVIQLIKDKLPVSLSIGLWTTILIYTLSIPLGIKKAVKDGTKFDLWSSVILSVLYAIPSFLLAIIFIIFFAGDSYLQIFPLRGLHSDNAAQLSWPKYALDYLWHIILPVGSIVLSGFATLAFLTKNSFLDEINKQYVLTARAKGLSQNRVLYGHIFRNAMLIVIAGFPAALISILFTGSLMIEMIFSLDGIGLLGYESVVNRDYPVVFATLYIFTLMGLVLTVIRDFVYILVDPRIDFSRRD